MNTTEIYEVELCTDCVVWYANGDTSGMTPEDEAAVLAAVGVDEGWHVVPGHVHRLDLCGDAVVEGSADCPYDEPSFSWTPCDACRRPLGGDRYPGAMWDPR
jgi:hypothetical protein